jgi:hypothetical protein
MQAGAGAASSTESTSGCPGSTDDSNALSRS